MSSLNWEENLCYLLFSLFRQTDCKIFDFFFTKSAFFKAGCVSEEARHLFREATYRGEKYLCSALHSQCV